MCARRGSEGAPSFGFLEHLCTPLAFTGFLLKQTHSHSKAAPEVADTRISCHKVPGSFPKSQDAQGTSTYQILAAGLGVMLPSWFKASPRPQCREYGCHGPGSPRNDGLASDVSRAPCKHCPDVCLGSLLPSSQNPSDFTFAQNLKRHPSHAWVCTETGLKRQLSLQVRGKGSSNYRDSWQNLNLGLQ